MKAGRVHFALLLIALLAVSGLAQTEDRDLAAAAAGNDYVVSVKPGGVNYVVGSVTIFRTDGTSGPLLKGDRVEENDKVVTGNTGRVEIMLNPGSFVRVDTNSEFRFNDSSLNSMHIEVMKGAAIVEAYASEEYRVTVLAGDSKYYLMKTGVFRFDVTPAGSSMEVHKGLAQVGNLAATQVKKGRKAHVNGTNDVRVSKFNRRLDSFESWSKARAKTIAKASKNFRNQAAARRLGNSFRGNQWNCYDSFGLWMYNPSIRSYGFLPFGAWRTPYGFRLRSMADICNMPWYFRDFYYNSLYRRYPRRSNRGNGSDGNGGNGGGSGGGGTTATVPAANVERGNRNRTPPFRRMERSRSVSTIGSQSSRGARSRSSFPGSSSTRSTSGRSTRSTRSTSRPTRTRTTTRSAPRAPRTSPPLSRTKGRVN